MFLYSDELELLCKEDDVGTVMAENPGSLRELISSRLTAILLWDSASEIDTKKMRLGVRDMSSIIFASKTVSGKPSKM